MRDMRALLNGLDDCSRRDFLALGAKALLGLSVLPLLPSSLSAEDPAPAPRPTARNVIYLYMAGGMSHLDTLDPKADKEVAGPVKALPSSADGLQFSEYLPKLAKQGHHCAVVRSMSTTQGAHEQGDYYMHTSYTMRGTIRHPALGAWLSFLSGRTNGTLPANVAIGAGSRHPGAGYLESKYAPLPIGKPEAGLQYSTLPAGIDQAHFDKRMQLLQQVNRDYQASHDLKPVRAYKDLYAEAVQLMNSKDLKAFDISQEPEAIRDAYGEHQFGQGCLLARRLIENDVRFTEVQLGGWDTHDDNFDRVQTQAGILDTALSTLLADLEARGLLDETLVVVATEFGRIPTINPNQGRDHYPKCFSTLLAGGGIKGGTVWGGSDERGANVGKDRVEVPDFNATIAYALGLPLDKVVIAPSGRPFTVADKGKPITGLFG
jgi:hypothetical protein